jgi:hypothetical protein
MHVALTAVARLAKRPQVCLVSTATVGNRNTVIDLQRYPVACSHPAELAPVPVASQNPEPQSFRYGGAENSLALLLRLSLALCLFAKEPGRNARHFARYDNASRPNPENRRLAA